MKEQSDQNILDLCKSNDSKNLGFHLLVKKYQKRIYWHVRRMVIVHEDADDLVQEVFVKIWKNLETFRGDSKLYTWIYRIATNETLLFLKKKKLKHLSLISNYENNLSKRISADPSFTGDEIVEKLQQAILTLPEKQRLVFNMRYYDEMKYDEISSVLGTSVGALKASFHIAAKKIERFIAEN